MTIRWSFIGIILCLIISGLFGWRTYHYCLDQHCSTFEFENIEYNGYYAGEIEFIIKAQDNYKIATLSAWLDGKPLIANARINARSTNYPIKIDTKQLSNGKHILKIEILNGIYNAQKTIKELPFFVDNEPLTAAFIRPDSEFKIYQGKTFHAVFGVNKEIERATINILGQHHECFPESKNSRIYECFVPLTCEETPGDYIVTVDIKDKVGNSIVLEHPLTIMAFQFKKQQLSIDKDKMKTEKELGISAEQLERELEELAKKSPREKLWHGPFYTPVEIAGISTDFGTIRITQEKGKYIHKAVDIVNTPKSVIWAPQSGIVVLKNRYVFSGNTVAIDHGYGILSLFFHLDDFADIAVGDKIKQGNPVGTLGRTGYASGFHLHWEMRINNIPIDPLQWIKPSF